MSDIKELARAAKQRLKNNFWEECQRTINEGKKVAIEKGVSDIKYHSSIKGRLQKQLGEKQDEFYLKVKRLIDEEGEVSDAIGRLTDKEYFLTLTYEDRQRYTMQLSAQYLQALQKYKKEKELTF